MTPPALADNGVDGFKIADWPLHGRSDIWTWGDGIRLAESARAELRGSTIGPASVSFKVSGQDCWVDACDAHLFSAYRAYLLRTKTTAYVNLVAKDRTGSIRLARKIMQPGEGMVVDHIDGNPLNNRRANLRVVTATDNNRNRAKRGDKVTSSFKGVSKAGHKWGACIYREYKQIWLGTFEDERAAAAAYDEAARRLFGECAALNFPKAGEQSAHRPLTISFHEADNASA